ncbi:MAG: PIN domain-containing protein [Thermoleophilia bacterium]
MATPWGGRTFLADTSAWARASHIAKDWRTALANDQIATCDVVVLELLYSTRDGADFDARAGELALLRHAPITPDVLATAKSTFRTLAQRHPLFHRSVSLPDLITAAAAAGAGIGVLHYDAHYDTLAEVLGFESHWIAPRGSLD